MRDTNQLQSSPPRFGPHFPHRLRAGWKEHPETTAQPGPTGDTPTGDTQGGSQIKQREKQHLENVFAKTKVGAAVTGEGLQAAQAGVEVEAESLIQGFGV